MGIAMRDAANALRVVKTLKMRDASNVLRTAQTIRMRDASNVLRTVWTALSASANPSTVTGTRGSFGPSALVVTSNNTTVTPAGGVGPFTYAWTHRSGDSGVNINAPTSATTAFYMSMPAGSSTFADFTCTVTDTASGATATAVVGVYLYHVDYN